MPEFRCLFKQNQRYLERTQVDRKQHQSESVNRKTENISVPFITEAEITGFGKRFLTLYLYLKSINLIERLFYLVTDIFYERFMCILLPHSIL